MNKETQLRKLIREELMKEGLWDSVKGMAKSYMDNVKAGAGYKKYPFKIGIKYSNDGEIEIKNLNYRSSSSDSEWNIMDRFDQVFYNLFNLTLDDDGVSISPEDAKKISDFLSNNSFTKTERNTSYGKLEVFTKDMSLKDINDIGVL